MLHYPVVFYLTLFSGILSAQLPVKLHTGVEINGITQWVGARGNDDRRPVLLFLHGGPGFSSRPYAKKFIRELRDDFIVAQWDQRETGYTKSWNQSKDSLTLELMYADTEAVVRYLLDHFGKEKLYLVGFSWGNVLGMEIARSHPELLHAYVAVRGLIDGQEADRRTLTWIRAQAEAEANTEALEAMADIVIPQTDWQQLYALRKWTAYYAEGPKAARRYPASLFETWYRTWDRVYRAATTIDHIERIPKLEVPMYFFVADNDYTAHHQVTRAHYESIDAPRKDLVVFTGAGHELPGSVPTEFARALLGVLGN